MGASTSSGTDVATPNWPAVGLVLVQPAIDAASQWTRTTNSHPSDHVAAFRVPDVLVRDRVAEAAAEARVAAQRAGKIAHALHAATANATETQLLRQSRSVVQSHTLHGVQLTPLETTQALGAIERAHDRRLAATKATAQRIVNEAVQRARALMADRGVGPWRAWETVQVDTLASGVQRKAFRTAGDDASGIDAAQDPTAFQYTAKHLRAALRRQARRLLGSPLQTVQEFRPKLSVLSQAGLLQTKDHVVAQQVAEALAADIAAVAPRVLRGGAGDPSGPHYVPRLQAHNLSDLATFLRLVNLANRVFAAEPRTEDVAWAWVVALSVALRYSGIWLQHLDNYLHRRKQAADMIQECLRMHRDFEEKKKGWKDWDVPARQFQASLHSEFGGVTVGVGHRCGFEIVGGEDIVMLWWDSNIRLSLGTRTKRYSPRARAQAMHADLNGFHRMSGPCPQAIDRYNVDFSGVLPTGCVPLCHPMAAHRLPRDVVHALHALCRQARQVVMTVDNFCIAPDGGVHCVHFGADPSPTDPEAGVVPPLQPPWLFHSKDAKAGAGALVQQLTTALYRLNQTFTAMSGDKHADVLAAMFAGLGSLNLFGSGAWPSWDDHSWFQAGAIALDALLGLSSSIPNVEILGLGVPTVQALVASAVAAMNKGLRRPEMAAALDSLDELPLLTMQISAPMLCADAVRRSPARAPAPTPTPFAILYTELLGAPAPRARTPFEGVAGHMLYSMKKMSDVFGRALLQHMTSGVDTVDALDIAIEEEEGQRTVLFLNPLPKRLQTPNLRQSYREASPEEVRKVIGSFTADTVLVMVAFRRHQHALVITSSQGSCLHFDPHGSCASEANADALEAWFQDNLARAWTRPLLFQTVQSWCNVLGPQTVLCWEPTSSGCAALGVDLYEYLRGSCMVWGFWFVCMLLRHQDLTPTQVLHHFNDEVHRRGWSMTGFLKHYLDDVFAYIRPYVVRVDAVYCIGSTVLGYLVDCSYQHDSTFQLLQLVLAGNLPDEG
jgi:hypothetical protein